MAIKDILLLGNPDLYKISLPVDLTEPESLMPEINLMWDSILDIRKTYGFGRAIAAPQIGLLKRIIAIYINQAEVMINPVILEKSDEMFELWDDCMSFPNLLVKVKRHQWIKISYFDINWKQHEVTLENDMAELIQHEYDHLEGILATQRAIDNKSFRWKT